MLLIVRLIPLDEPGDPLFQRRAGAKTGIAHQIVHVGIGLGHVARLHRQKFLRGRASQALLDQGDHFQQLDRLIVADVVDAIGGVARAGIGPRLLHCGSGCGGAVQHAEHALDDVVDVGEVPPHPAVIENVDRPAGENRPREEEQGHVGPAPGTVDREEPQPGGRQPEEMAVGMGHQLVGLFRGRIQAHGMIDVLMHRERHLRIGPVDRARRGIDQVLDARMPAALQDVRKAQQIAVDVGRPGFPGNNARPPGPPG